MTNEEKIEVLTAWVNGQKIEAKPKNSPTGRDQWYKTPYPHWIWNVNDYRSVKEPKDLYKYLIYNTTTKQYCDTHNYYQCEEKEKEFLTEYQKIIQRLDHTKITIQE